MNKIFEPKMKTTFSYKMHKEKFLKKLSYAFLPFIIFVGVLLFSYFGNMILNKPGSTYPETEIDKYIPFVPQFVYVYFLTFPLGIISFFYLAYANKKALYNMFVTLVVSFLISGVVYFFAQSVMVKPDFIPVSFTDHFVVWTWGSTNPINCFPSQHCFMALAIMTAACGGGISMKLWYKLTSFYIGLLIILSTVFIKQHYITDFFMSFAIFVPIYLICHFCKLGHKMEKRFSKKYRYISNKSPV